MLQSSSKRDHGTPCTAYRLTDEARRWSLLKKTKTKS